MIKSKILNRYIEDNHHRIADVIKYRSYYKDYVYLFDNLMNKHQINDIYKLNVIYLLQETTYFLVMKGMMKLLVNGNEYNLHDRSLLVLPTQTAIKLQSVDLNTKFSMISFTEESTQQSFTDLGLYMNRVSQRSILFKDLTQEQYLEYINLYEDFCEGLSHKEIVFLNLFARCYNNIIVSYLFNIFSIDTKIKGKAVSKQENIFRDFIKMLNIYASNEREVQFYAEKLGITPKYLSTITQEYSGKNASTWISEYVVNLAISLMREKKCKIEDVSRMLNFPSQSFFGRFFKRTTGISPKKYIKMHIE